MSEKPPPAEPEDLTRFWHAGPDARALQGLSVSPDPALHRLGDSPFTRSRFPILGFLETVYEQVATHAQSRLPQKRPL